ncbi:MAG: hypothetical protein RSB82_02385 [Victivallaceae bacterium]
MEVCVRPGICLKIAALSIFLMFSQSVSFASNSQDTFKILTELSQSIESNLLDEEELAEVTESGVKGVVKDVLQSQSAEKALIETETPSVRLASETTVPPSNEKVTEEPLVEKSVVSELSPKTKKSLIASNTRTKQKKGPVSNNMGSFEGVSSVQCEDSDCQACMSKKRTHSGISGITFGVAVAAIIAAALIISSAGTAATPTP